MQIKASFLQIVFIILFMMEGKSNPLQTVIQIQMPGKSVTRIRYMNENYELIPLTFSNPEARERTVEKVLSLVKPTIFRYSISSTKLYKHDFVIFPGDSIKLILNDEVDIHFKDSNIFLEQYVKSYDDGRLSMLNQNSLSDYYAQLKLIRTINDKVSDSLLEKKIITPELNLVIKKYNNINYYIGTFKPLYNNKITANKYLDSLIGQVEIDYKILEGICDLSLADLSNMLVEYRLSKINDKSLTGYVKFVHTNIPGGLRNTLISRKLEFANKSSADYKKSLEYLRKNIPDLVGEEKIPDQISMLELIALDGSKSSLSKEISSLSDNGLIVLDFWASWCKPCLDEFPVLKVKMEQLKSKEIKFVGINMDKDASNHAWTEISKKVSIPKEYKNYRLKDIGKPAATKFFGITAIPRYMILNKKGRILNRHFVPPSDRNFEVALFSHLRQ